MTTAEIEKQVSFGAVGCLVLKIIFSDTISEKEITVIPLKTLGWLPSFFTFKRKLKILTN